MISGLDFYNAVKKNIAESSNVNFFQEQILSVVEQDQYVEVKTNQNTYIADHVFKSYIDHPIDKEKSHYVDQHFKGWFVKTEVDFFDETTCNLMDFRVDQNGEVRFMYVLPTSKREALIELAIFSNNLLSQDEYDGIIEKYVNDTLHLPTYKIIEKEFGVIPMTTYDFRKYDTERITTIGTNGGAMKASSGYAFTRIQKHADAILQCISKNENPRQAQKIFKKRFKVFDATLLDVILNQKKSGADIFHKLFKGNACEQVFKFLDEVTSLLEEMKLVWVLEKVTFGRSFFRVVFGGKN